MELLILWLHKSRKHWRGSAISGTTMLEMKSTSNLRRQNFLNDQRDTFGVIMPDQ